MERPKRTLNLFDTVMLVSGSMIGSGIFIVSADMSRSLGSPFWLLMAWILSGFITLLAALSYGELAGMMPEAGGQFVYLKRAFGRLTAFTYGWTVFTVIQTGVIAAVAVAFAKFTGVFFPIFNEKNSLFSIGSFSISYAQLLAIVSIYFLTWSNAQGIKNGKLVQRIFTSAKLIALFGLIILGIYFGINGNVFSENFSNPYNAFSTTFKEGVLSVHPLAGMALFSALGVAMIGSLFSSDAWNNVTFIAGEVKEPHKNIPLGLFIGTAIVTVIYILANLAYLMVLPVKGDPLSSDVLGQGLMFAQNDRVGTAALYVMFGDVSKYLMAALIMVSTFGCNNGLILAGSRLFQSMANDGLFFKRAAILNKALVPGKALYLQALWASVLCLSGSYGDLLDYATFASLVFYIITISGLFILRKKEPDTPRPYKAFGYPYIPALYVFLAGIICIDLLFVKTFNTGMGVLMILLGTLVYRLFKPLKHN